MPAMIGEGLPEVARLALVEGRNRELPPATVWVPRGVTSHDRTWFEYAPREAERFDDVLRRLRSTEEWAYVRRAVDIRLSR
jgi:hypothetical protein